MIHEEDCSFHYWSLIFFVTQYALLFYLVLTRLTQVYANEHKYGQGITNPLLVFLNRLIWVMMLPTLQQNLLFSQTLYSKSCHWTFFIKNYWIFVNCSRTLPSFAMPSRILGVPTVLDKMRFFWDSVFVNFTQYLKRCVLDSILTIIFFWVLPQKYSYLANKNVLHKVQR